MSGFVLFRGPPVQGSARQTDLDNECDGHVMFQWLMVPYFFVENPRSTEADKVTLHIDPPDEPDCLEATNSHSVSAVVFRHHVGRVPLTRSRLTSGTV